MASDTMKLYLFIFLVLICICPVQGDIVNGYFTTNTDGWSESSSGTAGTLDVDRPTSGGWDSSPFMRIRVFCDYTSDRWGYMSASQFVDVTGYANLTLMAKQGGYTSANEGYYTKVFIDGVGYDFDLGWNWYEYSFPISGSGVQEIKFECYAWDNYGSGYYGQSILMVDNVELNVLPTYDLSGYITRDSIPVNLANVVLSGIGGNATSNESGYYQITGITSNTYNISVNKVGYIDYSDSITISSNTIKNISMSYQIPTLETLSILDSGDNSLLLGWKESLGADGVYIYVDSQEQIFTTVYTPYTNVKMYDLTNLEPGTAYNIWCKPFKDSIEGSMYYVSGATAGDGGGSGGGGGGGAVEVLPPYEDIQPETPEYPETYDMTNITSSDLITLAATNPEVIYEALSNITIKSPLPDKPGDNLLYFYLLIISVCSTLFSSKKEGWEVVTIISFVAVVISLIKLGWI